MKQHKWHKEIKAWADGLTIQYKDENFPNWIDILYPDWDTKSYIEFRIKPQPKEPNIECNCYGDGNVYRGTRSSDSTIKTYTYPQDWLNKNPITQPKEPQYLYVFKQCNTDEIDITINDERNSDMVKIGQLQYIGKIKLEVEE
jgi:hypothetical protein